jgi:hypothetical protein
MPWAWRRPFGRKTNNHHTPVEMAADWSAAYFLKEMPPVLFFVLLIVLL